MPTDHSEQKIEQEPRQFRFVLVWLQCLREKDGGVKVHG
jgi:hypothetical protein